MTAFQELLAFFSPQEELLFTLICPQVKKMGQLLEQVMQIKSQKGVLVLISSIFFGILPYNRLGFSFFYNSAVDLLKFYRLTVGDRKSFWTFIIDFYAFYEDLLASIVTPVPLL